LLSYAIYLLTQFRAFSKNNIQKCLCGASNCRGVLGPKPAEKRGSAASKAASAVKEVARSVKRTFKQAMRLDDNDDGHPAPKRRKTLPNGTDFVRRAAAQLTNKKATSRLSLSKQQGSRKKLAAMKNASLLTLDSRVKDGRVQKRHSLSTFTVAELKKSKKSSLATKRSRQSMPGSSSMALSSSPGALATRVSGRVSPKTNKFLAMKANVKKSSSGAAKSAFSKMSDLKKSLGSSRSLKDANDPHATKLLSRNTAFSNSTTSFASSSHNSNKKQARLSMGHGTWELTLHPPPTQEDIMADIAAGKVKIPKRSSSLVAAKAMQTARPSTAVSVAQSMKKGAAVAKGALKGGEGVRKTIRAVSGVDGV
jgi:hypothetical protein